MSQWMSLSLQGMPLRLDGGASGCCSPLTGLTELRAIMVGPEFTVWQQLAVITGLCPLCAGPHAGRGSLRSPRAMQLLWGLA